VFIEGYSATDRSCWSSRKRLSNPLPSN
jgi:hypothetical protein